MAAQNECVLPLSRDLCRYRDRSEAYAEADLPSVLLERRTAIAQSGCDAMTSREKRIAPRRKLTRAIA